MQCRHCSPVGSTVMGRGVRRTPEDDDAPAATLVPLARGDGGGAVGPVADAGLVAALAAPEEGAPDGAALAARKGAVSGCPIGAVVLVAVIGIVSSVVRADG